MRFGPIPAVQAEGAVLAHSVRTDSLFLRKGRALTAGDVAGLTAAGIHTVVTARLEAGDIREDEAADRLARACASTGVRAGAAFTGRANLYAETAGLALIDAHTIDAINAIDEAITLATLPPFTRVVPRQMLATVKIIPYAASRRAVERAEALLAAGPALRVAPFRPHHVGLILTVQHGRHETILQKTIRSLRERVEPLGSEIAYVQTASHDEESLAEAIQDAVAAACAPILIFGASAIADRRDVIPAAIELIGGSVRRFGMPVDPGNLLLLGDVDGTPVIGLPGCARSPKLNGMDFVLWRILAGVETTSEDIARMGVGGLLAEIPTRPQPRDEPLPDVPQAPKITGIMLAAGQSTRMGSNKLLESIHGKPLIRHAVEAALQSHLDGVIVVTGHGQEAVQTALGGLPVSFCHNPVYAGGLSTSLRTGLADVPPDCDGAMVLLGDMPGVNAALIDRLIAAFAPSEGRAVCLATRHGQRGNPVLWARRFFPEIAQLEGDAGARGLLDAYSELIAEVEAEDDAPLIDLDTPEALAAWRARK